LGKSLRESACALTRPLCGAWTFGSHNSWLVALWVTVTAGVCVPAGIFAQGPVGQLHSACVGARPALDLRCADAALAVQALHGGVGLLMTAGGPLSASPSTLGQRMAGSPRIAFDLGGSWASFAHPDISRSGPQSLASDERSLITGMRLSGVAGIFDGFSVVPGVGGVLGLDVVTSVQLVRVPGSPAASGSKVGWGGGVRVGLLRESFSLPGVTVSGVYQRAGGLGFGTSEGAGSFALIRPSVTSLRFIVGKDLWPVGLSVGAGWDRYRGDGRIEARVEEGGGGIVEGVGAGDLSMNRKHLFAGANFTWLVTQLTVEVGWARDGSPLVDLVGTGPFRAGGTGLNGALTFRFTY